MPAWNPRANEIFLRALEVADPGQRAALLDCECADDAELRRQVGALLAAHAAAGSFLEGQAGTGGYVPDVPEAPATGATLAPRVEAASAPLVGSLFTGRYKLREVLGEGGMGTVFVADQIKPVQRRVALKVIRTGLDSARLLARFEQERQALALMDHPNIAKVLDAGVSDTGQPYFAMELIKGVPITKYCDEARLTPRQRLELFIPVCQAVQHAHQKGIIHRDLKPSNILIGLYDGRPVPKVIDFGVAKATGTRLTEQSVYTEVGSLIGTLEYMSPEQAELNNLDIDTRSDIYALGVVLYELLTGLVPFSRRELQSAAFTEMLRVIKEVEPLRPSTKLSGSGTLPSVAAQRNLDPQRLTRLLKGDLDWIVMKCLEKERSRRYETANQLALDVQRYLADEPVLAGPPGAGYRLRKYARKYKAALGVAAAFVLLLAAAAGVSTALALLANRNAHLAHEEAARADQESKNATAAAEREKQRADGEEKARRDSQRLLGLNYVDQGLRDANDGRLSLGLLRMAQPLVVDVHNADAEETTRIRLANYRRNSRTWLPRLEQLWLNATPFSLAVLSPDSRRLVTMDQDLMPRVWDAATGRPLTPPLTHQGEVRSAAFSPDGRRVLTASLDGTVRVWDAATGQPLTPPLSLGGRVLSTAFSPDGHRILTAGGGEARVWDAASGQPVSPPLTHRGEVEKASFSPDGRRLLTASLDRTARVWDAATGQPLTPPLTPQEYVASAVFSPDGHRIVVAGGTQARVLDAATGQPLAPPLTHPGYSVNSAVFSPDGRRVVTASLDRTARVWDAATGQPLTPPLTHQGYVISAVFSPDGRRIITGSGDQESRVGEARVWDAATGQPLTPPLTQQGLVRAAFSSDGRRIITNSGDLMARVGEVRVWDLATGQLFSPALAHQSEVVSASFSPDGRRVVTASADNTARVWDTATGQPVSPPLTHQDGVKFAAFSPDGRRVVTAGNDKTARIWDVATGQPVTPLLPHQGGVKYASFSPDGRRVVTAGDTEARVWDAASGQPVTPTLKHRGFLNSASFSPDSRRVVIADGTETRVWDTATGQPLTPSLTHRTQVLSAAFSPDGRRVLTASDDKVARVWDAATGQPLTPPLIHQGPVWSATFSPDGRRVVTGSIDRTARAWDAATGQPLTPPLTHALQVRTAAFSPDGRYVVTASLDRLTRAGEARVWDAVTGQPITPPLKHEREVWSAAISPDGRRVVTASFDHTARVWDISPDPRPTGDLVRLAQFYSGHRIDDTGAAIPLSGEEVFRLWDDLRAKYPADFTVSPAAARAWREHEIGDCLREGNLDAAEFHYWWLVAEMVQAARPAK